MEKQKKIYEVETKIVHTRPDIKILWIVGILLIIGVMSVFSVSVPMCMADNKMPFNFILQQLLCMGIGLSGLFTFLKIDYKKFKRYAIPIALGVIVLLLIVKFTPLGICIAGARRWLNLGIFKFQPSEIAKISVILLMAGLFTLKKVRTNYFISHLPHMIYVLFIAIMVFLCLKQPNLSMAIILCGIVLFMYIYSGRTLKYVMIGFILLLLFTGLVYKGVIDITKVLEPHQVERIDNFIHGNKDTQGGGYQVFHSRIALSSGGITGRGYGASREKLGWLPEAHTDFIFSVFTEEFGFVGNVILILLYWLLFYRGMYIASKSPDIYGKMIAFGITISIMMQAFFNMAVASSFLPATGITLPFISYGGSSLIVSLCMIGILLNISKTQVKKIYQINQEKYYVEDKK